MRRGTHGRSTPDIVIGRGLTDAREQQSQRQNIMSVHSIVWSRIQEYDCEGSGMIKNICYQGYHDQWTNWWNTHLDGYIVCLWNATWFCLAMPPLRWNGSWKYILDQSVILTLVQWVRQTADLEM